MEPYSPDSCLVIIKCTYINTLSTDVKVLSSGWYDTIFNREAIKTQTYAIENINLERAEVCSGDLHFRYGVNI
jgi:hypothetical protein